MMYEYTFFLSPYISCCLVQLFSDENFNIYLSDETIRKKEIVFFCVLMLLLQSICFVAFDREPITNIQ